MKFRTVLVLLLLILSCCTTIAQSNPTRTATEELLISAAADRAAEKLAPDIQPYTMVFIDGTNFEGTDSKYALASIRSHMLQRGIQVVDDKKNADVIIEVRAGALSTDRKSFLIGIPQFNIPVPLASSPLPFPEISLYGSEDQKGVAKFAMTEYYAKKGKLIAAQEPQYGFSHNIKKTLLVFISWTDGDYLPEDAEDSKDQKNAKPQIGINGNGYAPATGAPAVATPASTASTHALPAILR